MTIIGVDIGCWTWTVRCLCQSNLRRLARSGKFQTWVGYIITMSGEPHGDTRAHRPVSRGDEFSRPTPICCAMGLASSRYMVVDDAATVLAHRSRRGKMERAGSCH